MEDTPVWIPLMFGGVMVLMGLTILGALLGFVPTGEGQFLAPPLVILALGGGLIVGGMILLMAAVDSPGWVRSSLFLAVLGMAAVVCNWSAFAPDVVYGTSSSISLGPITYSSEGGGGSRFVFGAVAVLVDVFILYMILDWVRKLFLDD